MLFTVDIGNNQIKIGIFDRETLFFNFRLYTDKGKTSDEYSVLVRELLLSAEIKPSSITGAIIASVVPPVQPLIERMIEKLFNIAPLIVEPGIKTGIVISAENPKEVGADLISMAVAALEYYPPPPLIVVSFGTATVLFPISKKREFLGAAIAPGVLTASESLFQRAAKLPAIELSKPPSVIGKDTITSMQSGIIYGFAGLVDRLVEKMKEELGNKVVNVIATGGLLRIVTPFISSITRIDPFLSLKGLRVLYDKNMEDKKHNIT